MILEHMMYYTVLKLTHIPQFHFMQPFQECINCE
jgi:hypothetical protein